MTFFSEVDSSKRIRKDPKIKQHEKWGILLLNKNPNLKIDIGQRNLENGKKRFGYFLCRQENELKYQKLLLLSCIQTAYWVNN